MASNARRVTGAVLIAGAAAGLAYTAFAISRIRAFRERSGDGKPRRFRPISIFKPLHGDEPRLYENLRSFCEQRYPAFQVIFCAADPGDPALETAYRLQSEYPNCDIDVVCGTVNREPNPKIANVLAAYHRARYDILVIADSDIRVPDDYLGTLAAGFDDERIGAVTCLYGADQGTTTLSRLGAMHVNDGFAPSVLVARTLEPLRYCFGATMAVRRDVLERIGGLRRVAQRIGDDYELGQHVVRAGYAVHLSSCLVHTTMTERGMRDLWDRELRWARTILAQRPAGFAGSIVTHVLPLTLASAIVAPSRLTAVLLAAAAVMRLRLHYESRRTFAPDSRASPWLIPIRDVMSLAEWSAAAFARTVRWRTHDLRVEAGGRVAGEARPCNDSVTAWAESPNADEAPASERR